jgi:diaminopimelate decarboxylase
VDHFTFRQGRLHAEDVPVQALAERFGTPLYVYSRATLERHWRAFDEAFSGHPHLVCYAVKANANLAVLDVLARLGSGFDIVSGGELYRVLEAGGDPARVVFSGVGKRADEIRLALEAGILCFNVESAPELRRIAAVARDMKRRAPVSIRVNPDVDPRTHPYIATGLQESKFGVPVDTARALYREAAADPALEVVGIDCHIGSQITELAPFIDALQRVVDLADELTGAGLPIRHLDVGGGLGIRYRDESPPQPGDYARALRQVLGERPYTVLMEPGRAIAGNAGILLTRVEYLNETEARRFAIVDAAMNDLLRPALYGAWQEIVEADRTLQRPERVLDVVGPVCETGDFLGKGRRLRVSEGDLLAVRSAGAYGFTMASNYNSRPRPAEVMVEGDRAWLVRARETYADLIRGECTLPERGARR